MKPRMQKLSQSSQLMNLRQFSRILCSDEQDQYALFTRIAINNLFYYIQLPFKKKVLQYDFKIISDISLHIFRYRKPVTVPPPQEFPEQLRYLLGLRPPVRYQ